MGPDGNKIIVVANAQKSRILNLDESALTLEGNSKQQGGKPTVIFFDGGLPTHGIVASKSLQSKTFITGSNAIGEVLPPHFQFMTNAKSSENERIRLETVQYMKGVRGQFGFLSKQIFPCMFGLNEKVRWTRRNLKNINLIQLFLFIWTLRIGLASTF